MVCRSLEQSHVELGLHACAVMMDGSAADRQYHVLIVVRRSTQVLEHDIIEKHRQATTA